MALGRRAVLHSRRQVDGQTVTEAVVEFKQPPRMLFADDDECPNRIGFAFA